MKYKHFPESCNGCPYETPTLACGKIMDKAVKEKKGWWKNQYKATYTKRRKDCPLTESELKEADHAE